MIAGMIMLLIAVTACEQEAGDTKFVPLERAYYVGYEISDHFYNESLIIGRVHKEEWRICYVGLSDARKFKKLSSYGEEALRLWLSALSAEENIVDQFKHIDVVNDNSHSYSDCDLTISKACKSLYAAHYNASRREVCVSNRDDFRTIVHEIGHAFGLGDTYIPRKGSWFDYNRYNKSEDNNSYTVGKQPSSIMCCVDSVLRKYLFSHDYKVIDRDPLPTDDADGIRYLYDKTHRGETSACPDFYIYEENTRGCLPTTIALIRGNYFGIPIYNRVKQYNLQEVDKEGNTTLHHAAMIIRNHGDISFHIVLELLQNLHEDVEITDSADNYKRKANKDGKTPIEIYQYLKSDVNRDGKINILDLVLISKQNGKSLLYDDGSSIIHPFDRGAELYRDIVAADVSGDGIVDENDLKVASFFFGK